MANSNELSLDKNGQLPSDFTSHQARWSSNFPYALVGTQPLP